MASLNISTNTPKRKTYEGAPAVRQSSSAELERLLMTTFLWENSAYQSGSETSKQISELLSKLESNELLAMVVRAREDMNLRHVPLFVLTEIIKIKKHYTLIAPLCDRIIKRPDEVAEVISIYWRDGKKPLPNQLKKGLGKALNKFSEYQLAKYQNKGSIKLVDVFNIVHPIPKDKEQGKIWKKLMTKGLDAPDTWEVRLSAEGNKAHIWDDLILEGKLGALAFLRNLRNMSQAGVDLKIIRHGFDTISFDKVLPFRFIAAAKALPEWEHLIENQMLKATESMPKLKGTTTLLIDVSGSMESQLSGKSDMTALEAACALAILCREICEDVKVYTFSNEVALVPPRRGFALKDAVWRSQPHGGTYLGRAIERFNLHDSNKDRIIVFTDEQSSDRIPKPKFKNSYMINVASNANSVATGDWVSLSGFSERIVDFIQMLEGMGNK